MNEQTFNQINLEKLSNIAACEAANDEYKLDTTLSYTKTFDEEMEEERKTLLATRYLESLGVKVKTDMYGYYRNTYDIILDLGEYLDKRANKSKF